MACKTHCCYRNYEIVSVNISGDSATIGVNRPLSEVGANRRFQLVIFPHQIPVSSKAAITLTDGTKYYPCDGVSDCEVNTLRVDSLARYLRRQSRTKPCGKECPVTLCCTLGSDLNGNAHVSIYGAFPESEYISTSTFLGGNAQAASVSADTASATSAKAASK